MRASGLAAPVGVAAGGACRTAPESASGLASPIGVLGRATQISGEQGSLVVEGLGGMIRGEGRVGSGRHN